MEATQAMWTIEELAQLAQEALRVDYWGQPSRQARDLPSPRAIRYYTMLGLLDRPIMRGRVAYYTQRHLAQLVAIKRLQAEGLPLVEIQQRLYGLTDDALEQIARLPATLNGGNGQTTHSRRRRFWEVTPPMPEALPKQPAVQTWQVMALAPRVQLHLAVETLLDAEAVRQIEHAARPLLRLLSEIGLTTNTEARHNAKDD
ncbi:hypothetical protein HRbin15_00840 [bacterium HR15]|nr:hypothetical protein HRbin15_00840 [bacterium HR15]